VWKRKGGINFNPGYFLPTYEVIYVFAKPDFTLSPKANAHGDVWDIPQERDNPHPAPFPLALAERVVGSTKAKIVLDPFVGSGTTCVAAKKLGRKYIGLDNSPEYVELAERRLRGEKWQG
jgi:modification methylase